MHRQTEPLVHRRSVPLQPILQQADIGLGETVTGRQAAMLHRGAVRREELGQPICVRGRDDRVEQT